MARGYRTVRAQGYTVLFAYDDDAPELLHIFARHLTNVEDALKVWFDSDAQDVWNEQQERFETKNETHLLLWCWQRQSERVLIISCMTRED